MGCGPATILGMNASGLVRTSRMLSRLTRQQLADMAGVAPSTVSRIENGEMDPSVGTLGQILAAASFRIDGLTEMSDPAAVAAARGVIESDSRLLDYPGADIWVKRWKAAGFITPSGAAKDLGTVASRAGLAARLSSRPGIRSYLREGSWADIARRIAAVGQRWAATGGAAANRMVCSADAYWPVFYVEDPVAAAETMRLRPSSGGGTPTLSLIPFDGVADVGVETGADTFRWVAPTQVLIDCYGGTGRMPEQADALIELFEATTRAH